MDAQAEKITELPPHGNTSSATYMHIIIIGVYVSVGMKQHIVLQTKVFVPVRQTFIIGHPKSTYLNVSRLVSSCLCPIC